LLNKVKGEVKRASFAVKAALVTDFSPHTAGTPQKQVEFIDCNTENPSGSSDGRQNYNDGYHNVPDSENVNEVILI
jgi:hypothetical protein